METLGLFQDLPAAAAAVEALTQGGFSEQDVTSLSSAPYPEGVLARGGRRSNIRWFALAGGVAGAGLGFLLAAGTAWLYPLHTGDKPIVSLFPVGIIAYEFMMLCAILGTIAGMFLEMGLPRFKGRLYDPGISEGLIGICVTCPDGDALKKAAEILNRSGAVRVRSEEPS